MKAAEAAGIKVVANERYARTDSSVAGQVLKIVAARPDAVFAGNSGTPGALPYLALAERGYKGRIYGTHGLINADFVRVGGPRSKACRCRAGRCWWPTNCRPATRCKKVSMAFRDRLPEGQRRGRRPMRSLAYTYDAYLLLADAARAHQGRTGHAAIPRGAARCDRQTKELVGTHGVYNFKPDNRYGSDQRARGDRAGWRKASGSWCRDYLMDTRTGMPMTAYRDRAEAIRALVQDDRVHRDLYLSEELFALEQAALLRQHLELPRPREPGAGRGRLSCARCRRPAAADGAPARWRDPRALQPLRAQGHAARQRRMRQHRQVLSLPVPRLDLQARRLAAGDSAQERLRRHAAEGLRVRAGAGRR